MKERPILFSGEMVRAILDGRKTQTRRIVPAPSPSGAVRPAKHQPGDRLWVRETHAPFRTPEGVPAPIAEATYVLLRDGTQIYRDGYIYPGLPKYASGAFDGIRWRPSIHMPRWASRVTLDVVAVRVERLQDITEADAKAEGVATTLPARINGERGMVHNLGPEAHRQAFAQLWDGINGKRAPWASNPFVWVVEFRRAS